jgi:hypothetical protein
MILCWGKFQTGHSIILIAGVFALGWLMRDGVGIYSEDSVNYYEAAKSLMRGDGYSVPTAEGDLDPLTTFPPVYSCILAFLGWSADLLSVARVVQILSLGASIYWIGLILYQLTKRSWQAACTGTALMTFSVDVLTSHRFLMSEGVFLSFALGSIYLLVLFLKKRGIQRLFIAASMAALAGLTRYAGVALVAGGCLNLFFLHRGTVRARVRDIFLFSGVGFSPLALWFYRNHVTGDMTTGRFPGLRAGLTFREIENVVDAVSEWFFQGFLSMSFWALVPLAILLIGIAYAMWIRKRQNACHLWTMDVAIPLTFAGAYLGLLFISRVFLESSLLLDSERILMPLHVLLLISAISCWARISEVMRNQFLQRVLKVSAVIFCLFFVSFGIYWVAREDGTDGYSTEYYRGSLVIQRLKTLPPNTRIYTNEIPPIQIWGKRVPQLLPNKIDPSIEGPNSSYRLQVENLIKDLREGAMLVYVREKESWYSVISPDEIESLVPLELLEEDETASLYRAKRGS